MMAMLKHIEIVKRGYNEGGDGFMYDHKFRAWKADFPTLSWGYYKAEFFRPSYAKPASQTKALGQQTGKKGRSNMYCNFSIMGHVLGSCASSVTLVIDVATKTMALPSVQLEGPSKTCTAW